MGIALILHKSVSIALGNQISVNWNAGGFALRKAAETTHYRLFLHDPIEHHYDNLYEPTTDSFLFCSGFMVYRDMIGRPALQAFYEDFTIGKPKWEDLLGHYFLVLKQESAVCLIADALGTRKVYHDPEFKVLSSSFIGLIETLSGDLTLDPQGCYEYAWNGTCFGGRTFFQQIRSLPANHIIELGPERPKLVERPCLIQQSKFATDGPIGQVAEAALTPIRSVFGTVSCHFRDRIRISFSGGFDSRLVLAAFSDASAAPKLFTYVQENDMDVAIAREIAAGEGVQLDVIDKRPSKRLEPEEYCAHLARNYLLFDGWKVDGLFDDGADALDRRQRHIDGRLPVNGSLGEIYRNFYYVPDRSLSTRSMAFTFYARYAPSACTDRFSETDYINGLCNAMRRSLGIERDILERREIELLYPLFRGRYWTGRDVEINQRFGWMWFPFMEPRLIEGTSEIPIRHKTYGRLESRMIQLLSGRLARYRSIYGYAPDEPPTLRSKVASLATILRPPILRKWAYRVRFAKPRPRPYYLSPDYLKTVIDTSFPYLGQYFYVDKINDPGVFNRIATMEYICQENSARGNVIPSLVDHNR